MDSTLLQNTALDALFPQRSQELTIWSKTSHKSKNHTEVYLAICLLLLMLKLNKIRCFIVKSIFWLTERRYFYCFVMVVHNVLLKASGPQHKKG